LVLAFTDQEQQVAVGGLHVEDGDLGLGPRLLDDLEELALAVGLHVEGNGARRAGAASRSVGNLQPCADAGALGVEEVRVHAAVDTEDEGRVRSEVAGKIRLHPSSAGKQGVQGCESWSSAAPPPPR